MQVAATKPSLTFFQPEDIRKQGVDVWTDDDEWDVRLSHRPLDLAHDADTIPSPLHLPDRHAAKLPHWRPDIAHRAPALGRRRPHRTLRRQHARKDRYGDMRQSRSKWPLPLLPRPSTPCSPHSSHHITHPDATYILNSHTTVEIINKIKFQ